MIEDIDLKKIPDQFCSTCGKKKKKYIGLIMGAKGVLFKLACNCQTDILNIKIIKSDRERFNELQTPFWKLVGLKPKEKDIKLEKFLKWKGMGYGDWRRERDAKAAKYPSALPDYQKHIKKYGRDNAPPPGFGKTDKET